MRLAVTLLLSVAAVACAQKSPPPTFAYDPAASFTSLKTYAWLDEPTSTVPRGSSIVDGPFIDRTVRQAVDESLQRKGLQRSEDGRADIYIAYHVDDAGALSHDKFAATDTTQLLDWSWDHVEYAGTNYLRQSGLLLDIRDSHKRLVWQGARTGKAGTTPKEIAQNIQKAVGILLAQFPPEPSKQAN